jgi:phosphohistidine phosphatase
VAAILLMRHAEAVEESLTIRESHRYLTPEGRRQAALVALHLAAQRVAVEVVLSSPLMRAVQTAELVAAGLRIAAVEALPDLAPGGDAHAAAGELARRTGAVLAVGHEPDLSGIGALLCQRRAFPPLHMAQAILVDGGRPVWSLGPADPSPVAIEAG